MAFKKRAKKENFQTKGRNCKLMQRNNDNKKNVVGKSNCKRERKESKCQNVHEATYFIDIFLHTCECCVYAEWKEQTKHKFLLLLLLRLFFEARDINELFSNMRLMTLPNFLLFAKDHSQWGQTHTHDVLA